MESITRVTWMTWVGNSQRKESCYFKSRQAADKCIESLSREKEIFDIQFEEGLSLSDVKK